MPSSRSNRVPPPVAPRPKQGAQRLSSNEGVKQSRVSMKQYKL